MCGIVTYIGQATNIKAAHELTTSLLKKTEVRGDNATGFWASQIGDRETDSIFYHKEPKRSTDFVNLDIWKDLVKYKTNLFVGHCRKSSPTSGHENVNKNNHPFLSEDKRVALVHNGNVPEFDVLQSDYNVNSDCDSEVLLRMLESGRCYEDEYVRQKLKSLRFEKDKTFEDYPAGESLPIWSYRLMGLIDIFSRVNFGAMAVAIAERWPNGTRALWLFRDKDRPLHVVDLRKSLGQVYAFSTAPIWRAAVEQCTLAKQFIDPNTKIIEFPEDFIWLLTVNTKNHFGIRKWRVKKKRLYNTDFDSERPTLIELPKVTSSKITIVSNLDENDEPIKKKILPTVPRWEGQPHKKTTNPHSSATSGTSTNGSVVKGLDISRPVANGKANAVSDACGLATAGTNANESPKTSTADWDIFSEQPTQSKALVGGTKVSQKDSDKVEELADHISDMVRELSETVRQKITDDAISSQRYLFVLESLDEIRHEVESLNNVVEKI